MSQIDAPGDTQGKAAIHLPVVLDDKLLEFVPGAVYVCDLDGVVVRYNRRAAELWGRSPIPGDPKEVYCGAHRLYRPSGEIMHRHETPMADAVSQGTSFKDIEVQIEQPSGRMIWVLVNIDPLRNDAGEIVGAINCFQDITDRKLADLRQQTLINELNHRVKNTLSTVNAIAEFTFRRSVSPELMETFQGRMMALSRAHDLLNEERWEGARLSDVVQKAVCFVSETLHNQFEIRGPVVSIKPQLALSFSTVLHELCTNALKYGSLSKPGGRVSIEWQVEGSGSCPILKFDWQESGGPNVTEPTRRGFGSKLIEKSFACEHGARVDFQFKPDGVRCAFDIPVA